MTAFPQPVGMRSRLHFSLFSFKYTQCTGNSKVLTHKDINFIMEEKDGQKETQWHLQITTWLFEIVKSSRIDIL